MTDPSRRRMIYEVAPPSQFQRDMVAARLSELNPNNALTQVPYLQNKETERVNYGGQTLTKNKVKLKTFTQENRNPITLKVRKVGDAEVRTENYYPQADSITGSIAIEQVNDISKNSYRPDVQRALDFNNNIVQFGYRTRKDDFLVPPYYKMKGYKFPMDVVDQEVNVKAPRNRLSRELIKDVENTFRSGYRTLKPDSLVLVGVDNLALIGNKNQSNLPPIRWGPKGNVFAQDANGFNGWERVVLAGPGYEGPGSARGDFVPQLNKRGQVVN